MKECLCCGNDFDTPTGRHVYPLAYEYCEVCCLARCDLVKRCNQVKTSVEPEIEVTGVNDYDRQL